MPPRLHGRCLLLLVSVVAVDAAGPVLVLDLHQDDRPAAVDLALGKQGDQPVEPAQGRLDEGRIGGAQGKAVAVERAVSQAGKPPFSHSAQM